MCELLYKYYIALWVEDQSYKILSENNNESIDIYFLLESNQ